MSKPEQNNFEASLHALERIVKELERGDLPLERSIQLFEQGMKLRNECQRRLEEAERRIDILMRDAEGRPAASTAPVSPASQRPQGSDRDDDVPF